MKKLFCFILFMFLISDFACAKITNSSNVDDSGMKLTGIGKIFTKKKIEIGEEMITKEQVKEELKRVHNLSEQAVALYNDNNIKESMDVFLKIPEKYRTPNDLCIMGNILDDMGKQEEAVFMYKRSIMLDETFYKPYYNIGNICLDQDKYFTAINYYKKAVKYNSEFSYAYYNLGCAYIKSGELQKAKRAINKAISLNSAEPDFHYNLAYVYKKLNNEKMANVYIANYNKLINAQ